jgi:hypothetical protein
MAKAGFWAISSTRRILFGKDGQWYADGEPIANKRIATLFSKYLKRTPEGKYAIEISWDKVEVEIEDTPYVVTRATGDPSSGFAIRLNDETEEALDPTTLYIGQDHVLYCRVKNGEYPARFLRPAYYQLTAHVEEDPQQQGFLLRTGDGLHIIRQAVPR